MPILEPSQQNQLDERRGTDGAILLWIVARNRTTGAPEEIGFWTGDDHQVFDIGGALRTYLGAGDIIDVPPIRTRIGLRVRTHRITLPPQSAEVRQMLREFEPRQSRVEVHSCPMDIDSGHALGAPVRFIKGTLNKAPERIGSKNEASKLVLEVESNARRLTLSVPLMRSNEELRRRNPIDRGREYSDIAGDWIVPWG